MRITKTAFSCKRDHLNIRGFEYRCQNDNGIPVILSHAFMMNQKVMKKYAKSLAKEGYIAFTYDFCGGAIFGKSDGEHSEMSIDTEKGDLKSVIDYVKNLSYVKFDQLILLGASQGGFVSCLVAAEQEITIDKLVLLYPALCIPDDARKGKMVTITFDPQNIDATFQSKPIKFSPKYPKSAIDIDIEKEISKITSPILIVHGDQDKLVDLSYAEKAIKASSNEKSDLVVLEGAGHGFHKAEVKTAMDCVIQFIKKTKVD